MELMLKQRQTKWPDRIISLTRMLAIVVWLISFSVLIGWQFDLRTLTRVLPNLVPMVPNTAACLMMLSVALWTSTLEVTPAANWIRRVSAGLAALLGGMSLSEYIFSIDLGIDLLLPFEHPESPLIPFPGRMATATAVCLTLTGLALLIPRRQRIAYPLAWLSLFIALTAFMGYVFNVSSLYTVAYYSSMAVHTAAGLILLNIGLLICQSNRSLFELLTTQTAGGTVARELLIQAPLVVLSLGITLLAGENIKLYDGRFSMALLATLSIGALLFVILRTAKHLHGIDISRLQSQQDLAQLNTELEQRVAERTQALQAANAKLTVEIQHRHEVEEEIRRLSLTDELTGLHNRRSFFLLADQMLRTAHRTNQPCLLFFFDLDGLKTINDTEGHEAGDLAIKAAAQVLKTAFRDSDVVARIGGDEFVALALNTDLSANEITLRIQALIDDFNRGERCHYPIALSTGVVSCQPNEQAPLSELMARADALMYTNKQSRRA